jgi:phosphohistidine swiveling domain-containing protein
MFIKPFNQISKHDAASAGGKGASLGEMTQAGIPVPPGFVILADSFEQFLKETDLNVEIDSILHTVNHQEMHTVEHASEKIQQLILEAKMPEDIASEIESEFTKLGAEFVAVRSSATAEDGAKNAWAGQLDSFLNTNEETLLENVKKCWASLFTPRAVFYRFEKGLHDQKISVAVVIQKMVASEKSGIAFSVHPVTEDRNQLIIEAGFGLGEAIVSGQITPDSYVVEKNMNVSEMETIESKDGEKGIIDFKKSYSRDTTLFMQVLWARGLTELAGKKFEWHCPYLPFVAHFVNDGVVEIWEHESAIAWFLDTLLTENKKGPVFLQKLFKEYKELLAELAVFHEKDSLSGSAEVRVYTELVYQAAFAMTIFFYTGIDERSPKEAQEISVEARKAGDFFAENDVFVRKCIARLGNISEEQAGVVLSEELNALPSAEVLNNRLTAYLLIDGKEVWVGPLAEFTEVHSEYNFKLSTDVSAELPKDVSGQIAFKGKVQGNARIVRKQRDMDKVKEGDILISPMTTPDFLPAMQKAAAFVTNEGGVTCHAAIVAREMKKPCVIGTKIATHIFKDGDLVEVDADNGVVRILERFEI